MSHVSTCEVIIKDLDALAKAAEKLGLELVLDKKTYEWYGQYMGDYNDPAVIALGISPSEYGKCEHVLRVKDAKKGTYEVGIAKNPRGDGFVLLYDFWAGGRGLMEKIGSGKDANRIKQEYANEVAKKNLTRSGFRVVEKRQDGRITLTATR